MALSKLFTKTGNLLTMLNQEKTKKPNLVQIQSRKFKRLQLMQLEQLKLRSRPKRRRMKKVISKRKQMLKKLERRRKVMTREKTSLT